MKPGRDFPGVSVSFYITDGNGNWYLSRRTAQTSGGHFQWHSGAGKVDMGETMSGALFREMREEWGCEPVEYHGLPPRNLIWNDKDGLHHWFNQPFVVRVNRHELVNMEPEKHEDGRWFHEDEELPSNLHFGVTDMIQRHSVPGVSRYNQMTFASIAREYDKASAMAFVRGEG